MIETPKENIGFPIKRTLGLTALCDMSCDLAVPAILVKDGAKEMSGEDWLCAVHQLVRHPIDIHLTIL